MAKRKRKQTVDARVVFVKLDGEDHAALMATAVREKLTISDTVRRAIRSYARKITQQRNQTIAA